MLEALVGGHVARVIARYDSVLYVSVCRRWTYGDAEAWVLALVWAQVLGRWGNLTTQHRRNCSSSLEVDLELASQALAVVLVLLVGMGWLGWAAGLGAEPAEEPDTRPEPLMDPQFMHPPQPQASPFGDQTGAPP